ncbi:hypothetical protein PHMEG_000983 [Phytophthora megakarya]|uniref:Uncharacterized protein n=1 Tax=Phytophthora megakarya TaxID=4795 RepID=A0A225X458_9STRA|nr:hypothetical protein PHMEG_000983 [Phytophthora megakarya]
METEATEPAMQKEATEPATGPACAQDVAAYCQKEANVVALLREAPDVVEPRKLVEALRKVRVCMITHADVLSVDCVETLSANAMTPTKAPVQKVPAVLEDDGTGRSASILTEVLAHPVTWVFVLPFFAVGLYVSFARVATFIRRRREERRIVGKQYMPVN